MAELSREQDGVLGNWFASLGDYLWTMVRFSAAGKSIGLQEAVDAIAEVEGAEDYHAALQGRTPVKEASSESSGPRWTRR